ncbi:ABC transporter ATP-binding protein [Macrococcus armenti]|uniref:ABC transporter ATP-binding protein n=1 Tax=Macrococcus armenti TaxID=2875764 RepID=UPI001CCF645D|nr:ABC transporter ATP-binding protein [Macrococcus armenti]UBH15814.1 ABC transporter ATP-binding protein [Macrococcus armenti]UBH18173.1 ABC transporter ATP-binding protein [Macrococcus armenti]UBH20440.1 ABC transporter ATP-binding protein [Macrococcus armenti]
MLKVRDIGKRYNKDKWVLRNINFEVQSGEFFVLVGPSGCGKSTLLKMIAGLEDITEGELFIDERLANHLHPKDRLLSMVFQNYALYPHMTVEKNILFTLENRKVPKALRHDKMMEAAKLVGLEDYLKKKPGELSGGQRQRVALARTIVSESKICLMDEPLSNLDAKLRAQMRVELRQLQQRLGITMIYVTHDQVEAMTMSDRIMVLNEGHIQQIGTPLEIYNTPKNKFVASFMGAPAMNIVRGNVVDNVVHFGDFKVSMSKQIDQGAVDIGFRPEDIIRDDHGTPVTVTACEMLGDATVVNFNIGHVKCIAKFQAQVSLQVGDVIRVKINEQKIKYFNVTDGNVLE